MNDELTGATQGDGPEGLTHREEAGRPRLRSVPGSSRQPQRAKATPNPAKPLTDRDREELRANLETIEAQVDALNLIEAAYGALSPAMALGEARRQAVGLGNDAGALQRVLACLAVEAVWMIPGQASPEVPRTDEEIVRRQQQLRVWCWDRRRAAMARLRRGRFLLRGSR